MTMILTALGITVKFSYIHRASSAVMTADFLTTSVMEVLLADLNNDSWWDVRLTDELLTIHAEVTCLNDSQYKVMSQKHFLLHELMITAILEMPSGFSTSHGYFCWYFGCAKDRQDSRLPR